MSREKNLAVKTQQRYWEESRFPALIRTSRRGLQTQDQRAQGTTDAIIVPFPQRIQRRTSPFVRSLQVLLNTPKFILVKTGQGSLTLPVVSITVPGKTRNICQDLRFYIDRNFVTFP